MVGLLCALAAQLDPAEATGIDRGLAVVIGTSPDELPARVTGCGLAVAEGRLTICCENGTVVCFR